MATYTIVVEIDPVWVDQFRKNEMSLLMAKDIGNPSSEPEPTQNVYMRMANISNENTITWKDQLDSAGRTDTPPGLELRVAKVPFDKRNVVVQPPPKIKLWFQQESKTSTMISNNSSSAVTVEAKAGWSVIVTFDKAGIWQIQDGKQLMPDASEPATKDPVTDVPITPTNTLVPTASSRQQLRPGTPPYDIIIQYLTAKDSSSGVTVLDKYMEKQAAFVDAKEKWESAKVAARTEATKQYPENESLQQQSISDWYNINSPKYLAQLKNVYMSWVIHGSKNTVESYFGLIDGGLEGLQGGKGTFSLEESGVPGGNPTSE